MADKKEHGGKGIPLGPDLTGSSTGINIGGPLLGSGGSGPLEQPGMNFNIIPPGGQIPTFPWTPDLKPPPDAARITPLLTTENNADAKHTKKRRPVPAPDKSKDQNPNAAEPEATRTKGAFTVLMDEKNPTDIDFQVNSSHKPPPADQAALWYDLEQALVTLKALFPLGGPTFVRYLKSAYFLARVGLEGDFPQPQIAARALDNLKAEILLNETGRVKNTHLLNLGKWAILFAATAVLLGAGAYMAARLDLLPGVRLGLMGQFCYAWAGAMAGTWISFGWRKARFTFEDLGRPEADCLWSSLRLIFTGLQTVIIGLLLALGVVTVSFGQITTAAFAHSVEMAVLVGLLCGFSEQTLPAAIAKQASSFFQKMEPGADGKPAPQP